MRHFCQGQRNGLCVSNTLEIDKLKILGSSCVRMTHFEAYLMVSSREVDSIVCRMAI